MSQIPASHADVVNVSQRVSLSTIRPDGYPQIAPADCTPDGDDLLLFIEIERERLPFPIEQREKETRVTVKIEPREIKFENR